VTDRIFDPDTDSPTNQDFDGSWHTLGVLAELSEDGTLTGGSAFFPNPKPANFKWVVFRVSDQAIVAEVNLAALPSPTLNDWNDFTSANFGTPGDVALDSSEQYLPAIATNGDFVYINGATFPVDSGGIVSAAEGRFHNGGSDAIFAEQVSATVAFLADMLVESGAAPSEVTLTPATVALAAQAFTATPGVVTVALTPAAVSLAAQQLTATPGLVTVALTPAAVSLTAQPLTATPGPVTVALTPAAMTLTARPFSAGPPSTPTVWTAGPPELKWHAGPPELKWHAGPPEVG
jgi:hypothetical protein